jgi:tRNA G37 N-methylase Trm5
MDLAGVFPVVAGGRLYLRDMDVLLCHDVKEPKRARRRGPRPVFVPSPQDVVEKMLEMAQVKKSDVVYDLGCGDGRIVVTAAKKYGCKAVGVDIDRACVEMAQENVKANKVEHLVQIERRDLFEVDLSNATVVTLYLLPAVNVKLIPQLEKLKPGARIVSHAFDMQGVRPTRVLKFVSKEEEVERPIYLWMTPLKKERKD